MKGIPRIPKGRLALCVLLAHLLTPAASAAPAMSTIVFGLPISFDECRSRVARALATEGYGGTRDFGNGWLGFTQSHSASVACIRGSNETVVNIVVASESENSQQRDRLAALMRAGGKAVFQSAHLGVNISSGGEVVVHWRDTPGNAQDWVSVQPVGSPDDTYGATWTYTQGQRTGSKDIGRLAPGEYEVRLYHDWPNGGFNVKERLRFRVGG